MLHVTYKTTDSIKVTTSSANTLEVVIDYSVRNGAAYPGKNAVASIAAVTTTTVLAAPIEAESCFDIERMTFSASGGANTITILRRVSGTDYQETAVTLSSGDVLEYEDGTGYTTKDSAGSAKFSINNVTGNLTVGGAFAVTGATTLSGALTYGGVTLSNAVTGTGNMVLSASPTFTETVTAAALSLSGAITGTVTGAVTNFTGASTTERYYRAANTSGTMVFGVESSVGGQIFTGSTAYAGVIGTFASQPVQIFTANTLAVTISTGQAFRIHNLAGAGSRTVVAAADGTLSAP